MIFSRLSLASIAAFGLLPTVFAGFHPAKDDNVVLYWGQNSAGGSDTQKRLVNYCKNANVDVILLSFLYGINDPAINFASATNECTAISGTNLYKCPQIQADIKECQSTHGKTIMLSIGGATYSEGGFATVDAAHTAATKVWQLFGPDTSHAHRPFGTAIVDGFDFDFESTVTNAKAFATKLRSLMDANTSKTFYLSAAPQCPFPDAADKGMLNGGVKFDFLNVQFYNNYCELSAFTVGSTTQADFNFAQWNSWAANTSANKNVKIMLGAPASSTAAGAGYVEAAKLTKIINFCQNRYGHFGGVMFWDASQLWANSGYLGKAVAALA